jgi:hypothetical protein
MFAIEEAQLMQVCKARLLDESDKMGVVDVPLWIKVAIPHL